MRAKGDKLITGILVVCALITTGAVLRREFLLRPSTLGQREEKTIFLKDWRNQLAGGMRLGAAEAPVQIIEFADFECPFCGTFHKTVKIIQERYTSQVALTYVHFPLPMHRFALPAARVSECAASQGRFEAMHDQLFQGQDQFGLKPWDDFAIAAGVTDMAAFNACIKRTDPIPLVEEGMALGTKLDVRGTPTVIINGWKLGRPPTAEELEQMVRRVLEEKSPIDRKS